MGSRVSGVCRAPSPPAPPSAPRQRAHRGSPPAPPPRLPAEGARQSAAAPLAPRPRAARTWPGRRPLRRRNARSQSCSRSRTSRSRSMALARQPRAPRISRREGDAGRRPMGAPGRVGGGAARQPLPGQPISGVLAGRPMGGGYVIAARGSSGRPPRTVRRGRWRWQRLWGR